MLVANENNLWHLMKLINASRSKNQIERLCHNRFQKAEGCSDLPCLSLWYSNAFYGCWLYTLASLLPTNEPTPHGLWDTSPRSQEAPRGCCQDAWCLPWSVPPVWTGWGPAGDEWTPCLICFFLSWLHWQLRVLKASDISGFQGSKLPGSILRSAPAQPDGSSGNVAQVVVNVPLLLFCICTLSHCPSFTTQFRTPKWIWEFPHGSCFIGRKSHLKRFFVMFEIINLFSVTGPAGCFTLDFFPVICLFQASVPSSKPFSKKRWKFTLQDMSNSFSDCPWCVFVFGQTVVHSCHEKNACSEMRT